MAYAKNAFYRGKEENIPILPNHGECNNKTPHIFYGEQHVYALCICCNMQWILLACKDWEQLTKENPWVGPAERGLHE